MFGSFAILVAGGAVAPGAPTIGTATATSTTTATVSFTQPAFNGGATITSYTATSSPGNITGTLSQAGSGTITVSGLTTGTAYTFTVTATSAAGTSAASSASNSITTLTVPVNTVAPVVSGTATTRQTLSSTTGTWTGTATISFAYQWRRAGSNISGATSSTYTLVDADVGSAISCVVTGTNSQGSSTGTSNSTGAVAGLAPDAPTSVSASAVPNSSTIIVSFTPPANYGSAITSYTVTSSPGGYTGTGSGSGIGVSVAYNTSYTFTVTATNGVGTSPASSASNTSRSNRFAYSNASGSVTVPTSTSIFYSVSGGSNDSTQIEYRAVTGAASGQAVGTVDGVAYDAVNAYTGLASINFDTGFVYGLTYPGTNALASVGTPAGKTLARYVVVNQAQFNVTSGGQPNPTTYGGPINPGDNGYIVFQFWAFDGDYGGLETRYYGGPSSSYTGTWSCLAPVYYTIGENASVTINGTAYTATGGWVDKSPAATSTTGSVSSGSSTSVSYNVGLNGSPSAIIAWVVNS